MSRNRCGVEQTDLFGEALQILLGKLMLVLVYDMLDCRMQLLQNDMSVSAWESMAGLSR